MHFWLCFLGFDLSCLVNRAAFVLRWVFASAVDAFNLLLWNFAVSDCVVVATSEASLLVRTVNGHVAEILAFVTLCYSWFCFGCFASFQFVADVDPIVDCLSAGEVIICENSDELCWLVYASALDSEELCYLDVVDLLKFRLDVTFAELFTDS